MVARILALLLSAFLFTSCSGAHGIPGGDVGATPGGAQDIGYARDVISRGGVPRAEDISVEGLLSEHDIPAPGPPCDQVLCLRPALGLAPSLETGSRETWVHAGLTSGLGDFVRPPLDLAVVIDKSASMAIDMDETNEAVTRLIHQLRPDDRLAVLAFDSAVHTIKDFGPVEDAAALEAAVRGIRASGGFDVLAGTRAGYEVLEAAGEDPGRVRRVVVLSCGYPWVSPDHDDAYSQLVLRRGQERIGLSFFGVLLGWSPPLADLLGAAWGGSYGYLESLPKIEQVFDEDFDYMMTPIAYALSLRAELGAGFELDRIFGVPGDREGAARPELEVATAFVSRRRGAIVARLRQTAPDPALVAEVSLTYLPEPAVGGGAAVEQTSELHRPAGLDPEDTYYEGPGVRKAVALVNMAERMQAACARYHAGARDEAAAILDKLLLYFRAEAERLDDPALTAEVALIENLRDNVAR